LYHSSFSRKFQSPVAHLALVKSSEDEQFPYARCAPKERIVRDWQIKEQTNNFRMPVCRSKCVIVVCCGIKSNSGANEQFPYVPGGAEVLHCLLRLANQEANERVLRSHALLAHFSQISHSLGL